MRQITNISELTAPGTFFIKGPAETIWRDFSGVPANLIERLITKPRLSRVRAAWTGVAASGKSPIISHLPKMTAAVSRAQFVQRNRSAHLAFSFNFTDLPPQAHLEKLRRRFARIDQFCVFSRYEEHFYPRYFNLPEDRFICLPWTQPVPEIGSRSTGLIAKSYVSSVGGEGRDYSSLIAVARKMPDVKFVFVARPWSIVETVPRNVTILTNLESSQTWRIVKDSTCLVLPLKNETTCCGHITLVSAAQLGVPVISSRSEATLEYSAGVALYEPRNVAKLAELIEIYHHDWENQTVRAIGQMPEKLRMYDRNLWEAPIGEFLENAWDSRS